MAHGVGTSVGPVSVGAGQQIVDKIAAQVDFDLSDGSLVGKLQRQNDAAIAQGKQVVLSYRVVRVGQRQDTEDLGPAAHGPTLWDLRIVRWSPTGRVRWQRLCEFP